MSEHYSFLKNLVELHAQVNKMEGDFSQIILFECTDTETLVNTVNNPFLKDEKPNNLDELKLTLKNNLDGSVVTYSYQDLVYLAKARLMKNYKEKLRKKKLTTNITDDDIEIL